MHKLKIQIDRQQQKDNIIKELEYKKEKLISSVKFQYIGLVKNQTDRIQEQYAKKLERRLRKINNKYKERQTKMIKLKIYHKVVEKKENIKKIKQKAFEEVQRYAKLSRLLEGGMLLQVDTGKILPWKKSQGGHIYGKKNFPHMAFKLLNIRPISQRCNKIQGDTIATRIEKTGMTKKQIKRLKDMSEDKEAKNKILDGDYYRMQHSRFKELNDKILDSLIDNQKLSQDVINDCTNKDILV